MLISVWISAFFVIVIQLPIYAIKMRDNMSKDKFSYDKYIELVKTGHYFVEADKYKGIYIPHKLYKYIYLDNKDKDLFEKKIKDLEEDKIWASISSELNDPLEFNTMVARLDGEKKNYFYEDVLARNEVFSLTDSPLNKLMWSHYASSHRGICLEYTVIDNKQIYPVNYIHSRIDITEEVESWIKEKDIILNNNYISQEQNLLVAKLKRICLSKDSVWEYEKEYRIVTRDHEAIQNEQYDDFKINKGSLHTAESLGLELTGIIIGVNNSDESLINRIVDNINIKRNKGMENSGLLSNSDVKVKYVKFTDGLEMELLS